MCEWVLCTIFFNPGFFGGTHKRLETIPPPPSALPVHSFAPSPLLQINTLAPCLPRVCTTKHTPPPRPPDGFFFSGCLVSKKNIDSFRVKETLSVSAVSLQVSQ
eukprot:TRINITY_DN2912_c0_g1_i2.p2 TRINITY_DN2912_c0_g1~~TRINITY_DN2912_c0_g1_i2.p2  ORF type:complete len:104 (+),score=2.80 TRINITY_DN2912_c0_g1_i2:125-436(+)